MLGRLAPAFWLSAMSDQSARALSIERGVHCGLPVAEAMVLVERQHGRQFAVEWLPKVIRPDKAQAWLAAHGSDAAWDGCDDVCTHVVPRAPRGSGDATTSDQFAIEHGVQCGLPCVAVVWSPR